MVCGTIPRTSGHATATVPSVQMCIVFAAVVYACQRVLEDSREKQWQQRCFAGVFSPNMLRGVLGDCWSLRPRGVCTAVVARVCVMVVERCLTLQPRCT